MVALQRSKNLDMGPQLTIPKWIWAAHSATWFAGPYALSWASRRLPERPMMEVQLEYVAAMAIAVAIGFMGHSFPLFARHFEWPMGAMFVERYGLPRLSAIFIIIMPIIVGVQAGIGQALGVFVLGCAAAYGLMLTLGYHTQIVWAIGMLGLTLLASWLAVARFVLY